MSVYLLLFLLVDVTRAQFVRFHPVTNSNVCPGDQEACVTVTSCDNALKLIKKGRSPKICGWAFDEPLICCDSNDEPKSNHPRKISRLSPMGCGKRTDASLPKEGILVHPPPVTDILESGVEPRSRGVTPPPQTSASENDDHTPIILFTVGGVTANRRWPWMVSIFNGNMQKQLCGGTLIDEKHIITAAHCFTGRSLDPNLYKVQVGELYLSEDNPTYDVLEIKLHEGYRSRYYYDDIAIIRLKKPLLNCTAACLPGENDLHPGENVTVLGWGDLSFGGPSTLKLQEVKQIPIIENKMCEAKFRKLRGAPFPKGITNTFICAGLEEGGKDACQGDSGGPLLMEHVKDYWTLVGVVSFGYKCGEPGFPGVYTRVFPYLQWIENYIRSQNEVVAENRDRSLSFEYIDDKPLWKSLPERVTFPK